MSLRTRRLGWVSRCTLLVSMLGAACSDDGVPADETTLGEGGDTSAGGTATDPTTQTTSVSDSASASGTTDPTGPDPTTGMTTNPDPTGPDTTGDVSTGPDEGTGTEGSTTVDGTTGPSESSSDGSSSSDSGNDGLPVGDPCQSDDACSTGVCWDFADYDPTCGGTACSGPCRGDDDCFTLIMDAGGANPGASTCGADGRCTMIGTGFGAFFCQGG